MTLMKILVIMSDNRKLSEKFDPNSFWSNTVYINKNYCDKFGYDFKYVNPYYKENTHSLYSCIDKNTNEMRHSSWSKLPIVLNNLNRKYSHIVYIDTDCIFKNFTIPLEDKIQQYNDSPFIFQSNAPWHPGLPCAGFFICKNTLENRNFLKSWYLYQMPTSYDSPEWQNTLKMAKKFYPYDWPPGKHWEQDALWSLIANNKCKKVTIDITEVAFIEKELQFLRHVNSYHNKSRNGYFSNNVIEMINKKFPSYENVMQKIQKEAMDTSIETDGY